MLSKNSVKLKPVKCCYCGKKFTPTVENEENDPEDFFHRVVDSMQDMLDDGLPLECGECRTIPEVTGPVM